MLSYDAAGRLATLLKQYLTPAARMKCFGVGRGGGGLDGTSGGQRGVEVVCSID